VTLIIVNNELLLQRYSAVQKLKCIRALNSTDNNDMKQGLYHVVIKRMHVFFNIING
jgi:hypothetical protein